jgi:PTS system mannose-specific IIA component
MAGILIIAHAPFASALRDCIAHVYCGLPARIGVVDVLPDSDPAELLETARGLLERLKEDNGALIFTDVIGATPANIAARLAAAPDVRVIAGVNLPMLLRAVCYRSTPLDTLADKAAAGGMKGIQPLTESSVCQAACEPSPCCPAAASTAGAIAAAALACASSSAASSSQSPCQPEPHASTRTHHRQ